jgi:hypothetical protein
MTFGVKERSRSNTDRHDLVEALESNGDLTGGRRGQVDAPDLGIARALRLSIHA